MVKRSEDKELYTWTVTQRFTKRRNELCEDRVKLLEDVGFVWGVDKLVTNKSDEQKIRGDEKEKLDVRMERWMKNYHKLKDFKKKHGHLRLKESQDRALYRWVLNQRTSKGSMYEDRVKLLEDIGFVWDSRSANKSGTNLSATKQSPQKMKSRSPPSLKEMQRSSYKKRKRGTENDDIQSHPFQQPVPKKLPKSLALTADCENLNKLHQFVRSDLLEIVQDDQLKKVGLQCIFCKTSPENGPRSKFFPQYLENKGRGLYRKTCEWQRVHFKQCTQVPDSVKEKYYELKLADKSRGKVQYWEDSAKQIGLFNKQGGGIGFVGDTNDGKSEAELARE
jgi:succinate dehydrogenase flavin-adding protein (antitoxin of CptAB toxin-antitoxin module)